MVMKILGKESNRKGFTMIELLIAITILVIGLLAAAAMQGTAVTQNAFSHRHSEITAVSQLVMDDLLSQYLKPSPPNPYYNQLNPNPLNAAQQTFVYQYNRFPPYNWESNPVLNQSYFIPGVGTFRATYTVITNTPARNISLIQVQVCQVDAAGICNNVPFNLINYRKIPT